MDIGSVDDGLIVKYEEGQSVDIGHEAVEFLQRMYYFAVKVCKKGDNVMDKIFECAPSIPLP